MAEDKRVLSLKTLITLLVCGVVALSLLATNILVSQEVAERTKQNLQDKATTISKTMALSPIVINGLRGQPVEKTIQAFAQEIAKGTDVQYIVVMDMNRVRKSHPNPDKVGQKFVGEDVYPALQGKEYTSVWKGTLGLSLRAFTPVFDNDHRQVGVVAVGISLEDVQKAVAQSRTVTYVGTAFGFLVGVIGAVLLARKIKATLFGLEPHAIAKVFQERSAMLESVREGIVAVNRDGGITLVNGEAKRIFRQAGLQVDVGAKAEDAIPNTGLSSILNTGEPNLDEELTINGTTILSNRVPVIVDGNIVGAIATFRDKTELSQLAEQLTGVRIYAEALRAQSHEFMNKLHVILGMVHMQFYDDLKTYVNQIAHQQQTEVGLAVKRIKDPVVAGFLLGKFSFAREMGAELVLTEESFLPRPKEPKVSHQLITIMGNLIGNALEAVGSCPEKRVELDIVYGNGRLYIQVSDSGPGIPAELTEQIFVKGYSTKEGGRGLGLHLAKAAVEHLSGNIQVLNKGARTTFLVVIPYESMGDAD